MKRYLFMLLAAASLTGIAQEKTVTAAKDKDGVYQLVDVMPQSSVDLGQYLSANVHYPTEARKKGIQGRVIVKFVVNEDGSISNAETIRGIGGGCNEEAIRVITAMPKWKPGINKGKLVKVYFNQPITFKLS
jgi:protein TonB